MLSVIIAVLCTSTLQAQGNVPENFQMVIKSYFSEKVVGGLECYFCNEHDAMQMLTPSKNLNAPLVFVKTLNKISKSFEIGSRNLNDVQRLGIFLDATCFNSQQIILESSLKGMFNGRFSWLIWTRNQSELLQTLEPTSVSVDTDLTIVMPNISFYNVIKQRASQKINLTRYGTWSDNQLKFQPNLALSSVQNFGRLSLNVAVVLKEITVNLQGKYEQLLLNTSFAEGADRLTRFGLSLFLHFKDIYNFTFNYLESKSWGKKINGRWDGLLGLLENGDIDLSITPTRFDSSRFGVADFVSSLMTHRLCFSFLQPRVLGSVNALATPLEPEVWWAFAVLVLLCIISYYIISLYHNIPSVDSVGAAVVDAAGAIAQQGVDETYNLNNVPSRIVSFFLLMSSYFVSVYYNAAILNSLLSPTSMSINSLQQLVNSRFELTKLAHPKVHEYSNDAYQSDMEVNPGKPIKLVNSLPEGVAKIKAGLSALYSEDYNLYPIVERTFTDAEICSVYRVDRVSPYHTGAALKKNAPYRELLARAFVIIRERGLWKREKLRWFPLRPVCQWRQDAVSMTAESLALAYFVYLIGILLSIIILVIELIVKRRHVVKRIKIY